LLQPVGPDADIRRLDRLRAGPLSKKPQGLADHIAKVSVAFSPLRSTTMQEPGQKHKFFNSKLPQWAFANPAGPEQQNLHGGGECWRMSDSTIHPPKQDILVVAADLKRVDKNGVRASFSCYFPDVDLRVRGCLWGVGNDGKERVGRAWTRNDGGTRHTKIVSFGSFKSDKAFQTAALASVHDLDARAP
jgi:hypothetical protein